MNWASKCVFVGRGMCWAGVPQSFKKAHTKLAQHCGKSTRRDLSVQPQHILPHSITLLKWHSNTPHMGMTMELVFPCNGDADVAV